MPTDSLLDHLEKTFADAYRKKIDQEEDVWGSLPFFAATFALQLAGLAQVQDWVAGVSRPLLAVSTGLLVLAGGVTLAAIVFLASQSGRPTSSMSDASRHFAIRPRP